MLLELKENLKPAIIFDDRVSCSEPMLQPEAWSYARKLAVKNFKFKPRECAIFAECFRGLNPQSIKAVDEILLQIPDILAPENVAVEGGWSPYEMTKVFEIFTDRLCDQALINNFSFKDHFKSQIDGIEFDYRCDTYRRDGEDIAYALLNLTKSAIQ